MLPRPVGQAIRHVHAELWGRSDTEKVVDEEKTAEKQRQADEEAKEAGKEGGADPVEPVVKYVPKTTTDWAVQNDNKPLWTRSPKEARLPTIDQTCYDRGCPLPIICTLISKQVCLSIAKVLAQMQSHSHVLKIRRPQ